MAKALMHITCPNRGQDIMIRAQLRCDVCFTVTVCTSCTSTETNGHYSFILQLEGHAHSWTVLKQALHRILSLEAAPQNENISRSTLTRKIRQCQKNMNVSAVIPLHFHISGWCGWVCEPQFMAGEPLPS